MHVSETGRGIIYMMVKLSQVPLTTGWSYFDSNWERCPFHALSGLFVRQGTWNLFPYLLPICMKQAHLGRVFLPEENEGFPLQQSLQGIDRWTLRCSIPIFLYQGPRSLEEWASK